MKRLFIVALSLFVIFGTANCIAGELDNPDPDWVYYGGWENATGNSRTAIQDSIWRDYYPDREGHPEYGLNELEVTTDVPAGGPSGQALRVHWGPRTPDSNAFVEMFPTLPNPYYVRVYFYSESPAEYPGAGGRKFMKFMGDPGGSGGGAVYLYSAPGDNARLHIKNHAARDSEAYNTANAEHLDGRYAYPGQESEGIIEPNKWYCIEFAHYRHNTEGWHKLWLNGKLVIHSSKEAWGVSSYDTDPGFQSNWMQMPSYRNGGVVEHHNEYFDNFIISKSYIGLAGDVPDPPTDPPTDLAISAEFTWIQPDYEKVNYWILYWGEAPGGPYTVGSEKIDKSILDSNQSAPVIVEYPEDVRTVYYYVLVAYVNAEQYSGNSNEVSLEIDFIPEPPPLYIPQEPVQLDVTIVPK